MDANPKIRVTGVECETCEMPMHLDEATGWWVGDDGSFQCLSQPWQPIHKPVRVGVAEEL